MVTASAEHEASGRWRRSGRHVVLVGAFALCGACPAEPVAPAEVSEPAAGVALPSGSVEAQRAEVADVVRGVFAALQDRDCLRLESLVGGRALERLTNGGGCTHVLETEPESFDVALVRMEAPRRDGRAPGAFLVRVLTRHEGSEQPTMVRVEWSGDGFRLVNM